MRKHQIKEFVKKKYGELAKAQASCCSSPSVNCCTPQEIGYGKESDLAPENVIGLGCGNPVALASLKEGETVLDLGSGMGLDCFLAANKIGDKGKVIGVDMTLEMVERAKSIAEKYGYRNVEFRLGEIENLPVEDSSVDVVISNCVINLSTDKEKVFREAYRVLKPHGRIVISDIVIEGEMPKRVRKSLDAWAACIGGAMEKNEYLKIIRKAGFEKVKILSEKRWNIVELEELKDKIVSIEVEAIKE